MNIQIRNVDVGRWLGAAVPVGLGRGLLLGCSSSVVICVRVRGSGIMKVSGAGAVIILFVIILTIILESAQSRARSRWARLLTDLVRSIFCGGIDRVSANNRVLTKAKLHSNLRFFITTLEEGKGTKLSTVT